MIPGEIFVKNGTIICNEGRETVKIKVTNTGDRPIQVGSHFHFFEVNKAMSFEREKAFGKRLNIVASTAVRFEPGEEKEVELVEIGGNKIARGFNNLVDASVTSEEQKKISLAKAGKLNFKTNSYELTCR
ncbi:MULTISPECIES: urease subunit beta [Chryseobacterium]|uniref:urease subunit beta n=1 Tax=Chryseobacterium TaxID=59732 RepID=UPI000FA43739|nr:MULTISPECIES: urease subunit beta [Chryseobacterium]MBM7421026.1 urease subunit beta/urease subunit gamma/beta [Chryseobacterium sp. JUb44]MDH6210984.1 urease subunit beta [Chryseobacterium sp. BIGb0186]WSO09650.1 urease subunit beta [Chryseobacterium scophthalmum]